MPAHRLLPDAIAAHDARSAEGESRALVELARAGIESDIANVDHFLMETPT